MRTIRTFFLIFFAICMLGYAHVAAAAANISNSYNTTQNITPNSLLSLDPDRSGFVIQANQNFQDLVGVATSSSQSLLSINSSGTNIHVAVSGIAYVFVSTLNGSIGVGDLVGVSPISGVGMRAEPNTRVIGTAQTTFSSTTKGVTPTTVTNKNGKSSTVYVGTIPVSIAIGTAPVASGQAANIFQKAASSIVGHNVSTLSLVISTAIIIVTITSVIVLVYGTIRGSLISVGRNPLAKPAIFESLAQVLGMICVIILVAIISVYLILR